MKNTKIKNLINLLLLFVFVFGLGAVAQAQNRKKRNDRKKNRVQIASITPTTNKIVDTTATQDATRQNILPTVKPTPIAGNEINLPKAETSEIRTFENGSIVVQVTSNSNATVKIPLAQGGVSVIEFPKDDPAIAIHPGDENLVSLDCKKRDESGYCTELANLTQTMVIRPTADFKVKPGETSPMTAITVQRRSGMVVSFICYPVADLTQNAFYVAVRYDPSLVIRARQEAGLPTELDVPNQLQLNAKNSSNQTAPQTDVENQPSEAEKRETELAEMTVEQLKTSVRNTQKWSFSKPVHGLSVAVAARQNRTDDTVVETIAVKNTLSVPVRLVPDQPELFIRQSDGSNKQSAMVSRVAILHIASTAPDADVLQPGQVYYYAIAYKLPVLGAKQALWISFAQMNAADEPVQADLTINAR